MAKTVFTKLLDPMDLWRDALAQWEGGANAAANKQMGSQEFTQVLHAMTGLASGLQQAAGKANGAVLKELNLPNRNDLIAIGERLERIEEAIEQLARQIGAVAPAPKAAHAPAMPPRTRKPPSATAPTPAAPAGARTKTPPRKRPTASRNKA